MELSNTIIFNKYKLIEKLGGGSYGNIYKAINIRTNQYAAIKIESLKSNIKLLKNETKIYQYLSGIEGIPTVLYFGIDEENNYMIITLCGKSLQNIIDLTYYFSLNDVISISKKMVKRLESIHNKGLIHRDVKPDNFLFGLEDKQHILYLIDFGFCKRYLLNDRTHIPLRENRKLIGTPNFVSINIHYGLEPSRRDDLESVTYIMLYLLNKIINWSGFTLYSNIDNNIKIAESKLKTMTNKETPTIIRNFFQYCRSLAFEETPDYNKIYELLDQKQ